MDITMYVDKYKSVRYNFFKWRYELEIIHKVWLAFTFACLTGLLSQVRFYLPGNPAVPITGQTFAVLLAGVVLGRWGVVSLGMYTGIGAAGVPWFAPKIGMPIFSSGGIGALTGATGGYIVGFMIAALFLGYITDKYIRSRSFFSMLPLMFFANFVLIYIPGLIVLYLWWMSFIGPIRIVELLTVGMIPFIAGDILKIVSVSAIAKGITPKRAYGREADIEKSKSWHIP
ncbi:MAG: biotin transporter BioY [Thermoplasmatales archaeon]|nr:MAG: biotin transporter BioY [Thermoplasmatales archaeon]